MHLWGRTNSANVMKVLWCLQELGLECDRTDAGMQFGKVNDPEYRALNPNGRVPTLQDGDMVLWESNSILRYLCLSNPARAAALYPPQPALRAKVDRWLDWQLSTLAPVERIAFHGLIRTAPEKRDTAAIAASLRASAEAWQVVEDYLAAHRGPFLEGAPFTIADVVIGIFARRWYGFEMPDRPAMPFMAAWYRRLQPRPGFQRYLAPPLT
jgi:glutathione S-transferase